MTLSAVPLISSDPAAQPTKGRIFNIQRFSLNDGQGIRTLVFFKGCPHGCPWCANPESISPRIQTIKRQAKCLNCPTCQQDPVECPSGAMEYVGEDVTLPDLMARLMKDEVFFRSSGGGVTLSGGEVLMQHAFASKLLQALQALGIHTAIETAGDAPLPRLISLTDHCDQVLFDFKIMDPSVARSVLRINQPRVLANFSALAARGVTLIPRLPLIPGYTLTRENIVQVLDFLHPFRLTLLHLLPFHKYGEAKYSLLGTTSPMNRIPIPGPEEIASWCSFIEEQGYTVTLGG